MSDDFPKIVPIDDVEQARADAIERVKGARQFIVITSDESDWHISGAWYDFTTARGAVDRYFTRMEVRNMLLEEEEG